MSQSEFAQVLSTQELDQIVEERWKLEAFRRFQCIWLSRVAHLTARSIAEALCLNISTVRRIHAAFRRDGRVAIEGRGNRGGRRKGHLTLKEEAAFLDTFAEQSTDGRIHTINALKKAYESRIGKRVNKTTIYRLLERHGWGGVATRIHWPRRMPLDLHTVSTAQEGDEGDLERLAGLARAALGAPGDDR